jgi:hypothetical protein
LENKSGNCYVRVDTFIETLEEKGRERKKEKTRKKTEGRKKTVKKEGEKERKGEKLYSVIW